MNPAKIYQTLSPNFPRIAHDGEIALKHLKTTPNSKVLDIGTGQGNFAVFLALQGFKVITGEPSTDTSHYAGHHWENLAKAAGVSEKISFQHFDAHNLPFENGSFSTLFFFGVLHHIEEKHRISVMEEAFRVASKSVVFFEPTEKTLEKIWLTDPTHPQAASPSKYIKNRPHEASFLKGKMMDIYILQTPDV